TRAMPRWVLGGFAVLVVAGVSVGGFLASRRPASPVVSAPRAATSVPVAAPPPTPAVVPAAEVPPAAPATFAVIVVAQPSTARIELDHELLPGSAVARSLHRNGVEHLLRVTAEGYDPFEIPFTDVAPPSSVTLTRVVRGRTPTPNRAGATTAAAPPPDPQPPQTPPTQPPATAPQPRTGINGAPVGQE
ncbi:MAG: hypothetical protein WCJ30_21980, partial [Deltaproteobacteria bacterium]